MAGLCHRGQHTLQPPPHLTIPITTTNYNCQVFCPFDNSGTNPNQICWRSPAPAIRLTTSDAHKYLGVVVTANDGHGGSQTATSAYTQVTNSAPVNSAVPSVSGIATVGNALATTNGTWSDADGDGRTYSYQWYRADDSSGTNLNPRLLVPPAPAIP